MILKPTLEMLEKLIVQEMAVRFSIGSQANSTISEAITALSMNFQIEIRKISYSRSASG